MGLFYAVPLQSTPATKNHQADYPPATYCISTFLGGWGRDQQDRDWKFLSLNNETETEKGWVSITRPKLKYSSVNDETKTETKKMQVSMMRPRPRLQMCESQWRDQDRDWNIWVSMTRPRLKKSESQKHNWAKDVDT